MKFHRHQAPPARTAYTRRMDVALPADPIAAVTHPDPYAYYAALAAAPRPEWHEALGLWVAADPQQVVGLLRHPDARVVAPPDAPAGFAEYARFNDGERHAALRAEVVERIAHVQLEEPPLALDDLDAFVEHFALYAMARDLRSMVKGDLLFQSYDATRGLIGNALCALAGDPALGAEGAVAHALRYDPPVHNTRRKLAADVEVAGARMAAGDVVLLVLVGMTFGAGPHACPGDALATRIAEMAVRRVISSGVALRKPAGYVARPNVRIPLFGPTGERPPAPGKATA
jgi:cytochrome P450